MDPEKFDIRTFWREQLDLTRIRQVRRRYPFIDQTFTDELLERGFCQAPYFYYPLSHWLDRCDVSALPIYRKALGLLDAQLHGFLRSGVRGIEPRLDALKTQGTPESFYSFLSEAGIAWHFHYHKRWPVDFFDYLDNSKRPRPDLRIVQPITGRKLYVEVYTHFKFYQRLSRLRELLWELDPRLRIARDLFLQSPPSVLDEKKVNEIVRGILAKLRSKGFKKEAEREYQIVLYEDGNLQIYIEIDENWDGGKNYRPHLIKGGGGDFQRTFEVQLREVIQQKVGRGQLGGFHPNVLALNTLFNIDIQTGASVGLGEVISKLELPEPVLSLDALYLFPLGIETELVCFTQQGQLFIRADSEHAEDLRAVLAG